MLSVDTELDHLLHRLARFQPPPSGVPIISLYLNAQADEHGRDRVWRFIQDELHARVRGFHGHDGLRESLQRDVAQIDAYLARELRPGSNGVAIFSCAAANLFEALQLDAPFPRHQLHLTGVPHLYPLALVSDQFPRYAALVADTHTARILVFALNRRVNGTTVENEKTRRTSGSGWAQARFQRHIDEQRLQHAREVVTRLDEVVRADKIQQIVLGGDEVILPMLRSLFPPHLAALVVDALPLEITTPDHQVLQRTLDVIRKEDARTDQQIVDQAFDGHRAGGLGVVGCEPTRAALARGQVHVLLLSAGASPDGVVEEPAAPKKQYAGIVDAAAASPGGGCISEEQSNEFLTLARQTDAEVRFIEDPNLLRAVGGVAALLRFRLNTPAG